MAEVSLAGSQCLPVPVPPWRENSPKGKRKKPLGGVWLHIKRLAEPEPSSKFTHVCLRCGDLLRLTKHNVRGSWLTTRALEHNKKKHPHEGLPGSQSGHRGNQGSIRGRGRSSSHRNQGSNHHGQEGGVAKRSRTSAMSKGKLATTRRNAALEAQARMYTYCSHLLSEETFNDPTFRAVLQAQHQAGGGDPTAAPSLRAVALSSFVHTEHAALQNFVRGVVEQGRQHAFGNPFAQGLQQIIHLSNGRTYVAIGITLVDPSLEETHTLCLGIPEVGDTSEEAVDAVVDDVCQAFTGHQWSSITFSTVTEFPAFSAASVQEAAVNNKVVAKASQCAAYFSDNSNHAKLKALASEIEGGVAAVSPCGEGSGVAGRHSMILNQLRLNHLLQRYAEAESPAFSLTRNEWKALAEIEAILHAASPAANIAEAEHSFTGAIAPYIRANALEALRSGALDVIDLPSVSANETPRISRRVSTFTDIGKECLTAVKVQMERLYCGSNSDRISNTDVVVSDRETMATLLDPRTLFATTWSQEERENAMSLLSDAYIEYGLFSDVETAAAQGRDLGGAGDGLEPSAVDEEDQEAAAAAAAVVAEDVWSFVSDDDEEDEDAAITPAQVVRNERTAVLREEFNRVFKNWVRRLRVINWKDDCGVDVVDPDTLDDLRSAPLGHFYQKLVDSDPRREEFGFLPYMATHSRASIASSQESSFSERTRSIGDLILSQDTSVLEQDETNITATLRTNKDFMAFMNR